MPTQVGDDPFSQMAREKKERVKTNAKRQLANMKANAKAGDGQVQLPPTLKLAASLPEHGKGRPIKRKDMHNEVCPEPRSSC
jgi:regulator of ribosome biosynthesis